MLFSGSFCLVCFNILCRCFESVLPFFFLHSKPGKPRFTSDLRIVIPVFCFSKSFVFRAWFFLWPLTFFLLSFTQTLVFGSFACATTASGFSKTLYNAWGQGPKKTTGRGCWKKKKTSGEVFTPNGNKHMKVIVPTCVKEMGSQSFTQEEYGWGRRDFAVYSICSKVKVKVMVRNGRKGSCWFCEV